ncbi:Regulator of telomere elongation helicase 1 [Porphyridium purpureum]|uniref:Regulator of telomere elongation helicase 1 homolog n=1 Tax=Porphyridium purpureum TaxID=35688 RepID=A0A5J4YHK1_PORPP|nr:Regulator of telomere elongation helicase 1 [Porphyridium purpureum]|eukprot:POR3635..scf251_18
MPLYSFVTASGLKIEFPFEPYECQKKYMESVLEALCNRQNALLESPTGTGKTLCLLCASLAWREAYVAAFAAFCSHGAASEITQEHARKCGVSMDELAEAAQAQASQKKEDEIISNMAVSSQLASLVSERAANKDGVHGTMTQSQHPKETKNPIPRIIYSSRTHSQLQKVVSELRNTSYRPRLSVLGSREQTCIHETVSKLKGPMMRHECRKIVSQRKCSYRNAVDGEAGKNATEEAIVGMADIEELVDIGRSHRACPYYLSRKIEKEAEIILLPYNYLIDPSVRDALKSDFANDVIILDEAHNVDSVCEEAVSFDLAPAILEGAVRELIRARSRTSKFTTSADAATGSKAAGRPGAPGSASICGEDCTLLITLVRSLQEQLKRLFVPEGKEVVKDGSYILELFRGIGITQDTASSVVSKLDAVIEKLNGKGGGGGDKRDRGNGGPESFESTVSLDYLKFALSTVFRASMTPQQMSIDYRVCIRDEQPKFKSNDRFRKKQGLNEQQQPQQKQEDATAKRVLGFWCLTAHLAMQDLQNLGVRSILLTSGTLSPLEGMAAELRIPFNVRLENPHVVTKEQVWGGVLMKGPSGVTLNSSFKNRDSDNYRLDLGRTLVNFASSVPDGILVFFPSYAVMNNNIEYWKTFCGNGRPQSAGQRDLDTIWQQLDKKKPLVVEPKNPEEFVMAMREHKANVKYRGAGCFMAVCRGKVSEGIDFADADGRGVLVTGIPYPQLMDAKVRLKREYMDRMVAMGNSQINGNTWYSLQATKAINQALGRVIRHRNDYGALLLCDERFAESGVKERLSVWIRPYVSVYSAFGLAQRGLSTFFRLIAQGPYYVQSSASLPCDQQSNGVRVKEDAKTSSSLSAGRTGVKREFRTPYRSDEETAHREKVAKLLPRRNNQATSSSIWEDERPARPAQIAETTVRPEAQVLPKASATLTQDNVHTHLKFKLGDRYAEVAAALRRAKGLVPSADSTQVPSEAQIAIRTVVQILVDAFGADARALAVLPDTLPPALQSVFITKLNLMRAQAVVRDAKSALGDERYTALEAKLKAIRELIGSMVAGSGSASSATIEDAAFQAAFRELCEACARILMHVGLSRARGLAKSLSSFVNATLRATFSRNVEESLCRAAAEENGSQDVEQAKIPQADVITIDL